MNAKMEKAILKAVRKHLDGIETLETRKSDSADFHEVAVWCLKAALEAAYKAGRDDEQKRAEATCRRNAARA